MRSNEGKRVFFFLSGGWGPLVRTLPIAKWLAEHGIGSSLGIGGAIGAHLRAAGYEVIEAPLPAFNAPADAARGWWSPYHFLSDCSLGTELLVEHVEAYRTAIRDGQPAIVLTDINRLQHLQPSPCKFRTSASRNRFFCLIENCIRPGGECPLLCPE
jgi:hypothetical protein